MHRLRSDSADGNTRSERCCPEEAHLSASRHTQDPTLRAANLQAGWPEPSHPGTTVPGETQAH